MLMHADLCSAGVMLFYNQTDKNCLQMGKVLSFSVINWSIGAALNAFDWFDIACLREKLLIMRLFIIGETNLVVFVEKTNTRVAILFELPVFSIWGARNSEWNLIFKCRNDSLKFISQKTRPSSQSSQAKSQWNMQYRR
jgi:hypothetical protein